MLCLVAYGEKKSQQKKRRKKIFFFVFAHLHCEHCTNYWPHHADRLHRPRGLQDSKESSKNREKTNDKRVNITHVLITVPNTAGATHEKKKQTTVRKGKGNRNFSFERGEGENGRGNHQNNCIFNAQLPFVCVFVVLLPIEN